MSPTPVLLALLLLAPSPAPAQKPKESFWQKVLRITGISAMPSTSKGLPGEADGGDLWVATADGTSRLRLTRDGGYQSPIFDAEGGAVLALHQGTLVRVSTAGFLDPEPLFAVPGVVRLIGIDHEAPGQVVVLTRTAEGATDLGRLDLTDPRDRQVRSLATGAKPAEVEDAIAKLARWDRIWQVGEPPRLVSLKVHAGGKGSDVLCQSDGAAAVDVSHCAGDRCGQPALSADGRKVVYVRALPAGPS